MTAWWGWVGFNRDPESEPNPLAEGTFCDRCGARLDKADRPCPMGPHPRRAA